MHFGKVEVAGSFLFVMALLHYMDGQGIVLPTLLFCLLHELGHYVAIACVGGRVDRVRVTAVGAEMHLDGVLSYRNELIAALAGPTVNIILALLFVRLQNGAFFAGINLALALFNLLPIGSLDGGRVLACFSNMVFGPERTEQILWCFDLLISSALLALGCWTLRLNGNFTLLIVAVWLFVHKK